jgi:hypothetical protein
MSRFHDRIASSLEKSWPVNGCALPFTAPSSAMLYGLGPVVIRLSISGFTPPGTTAGS